MTTKWNKITWYSKALALALFIVLSTIGFWLGRAYGHAEQYNIDHPIPPRVNKL